MRDLSDTATGSRASLFKLLISLAAAVALFVSWKTTQETGMTTQDSVKFIDETVEFEAVYYPNPEPDNLWQSLDHKTFLFLNGSLEGKEGAQKFWAAANNRACDLLQALLMGIALYLGVFYKGTAAERLKKLEFGLFLGAMTVISIQLAHFAIFNFYRVSPSLILTDDVIRLSKLEHITWHLKDASFSSFPGDHATVLFIGAVYIAYFSKLRFGALAILISLLCALPRLVAGAHWMTDVVVGGGAIAIVSCSLTLCLQKFRFGPQITRPLAIKLMAIVSRFLPGYDLSEKS